MKYVYQASGDSIRIVEPETGFIFGHVADAPGGKYRVTTPGAKLLALVDTVDDAPPVLVDYHDKHPTKWARDSLRKYSRDTPFGLLRVEQNASGAWSTYRECREYVATLRSGNKQAAFRTVTGAQAITDANMREKVGRVNEDGLRWAVMWARLALSLMSPTKGSPAAGLRRVPIRATHNYDE